MHDDIKRFHIEGITDDRNVIAQKERMVRFLEDGMRTEGFIPVFDLEPQLTLDYDPETEQFAFLLSVWGSPVEKEIVWRAAGMMGGKMIMKSTPPIKSKESSDTPK